LSQIEKKSAAYIKELEDKIIELSLGLKSKKNELNSVYETNHKIIGRLVHNLKNPVGVIFSFSEMILENIEDYTPEKLEKHVQIIKNSAEFSIQLLNSIAKYSQLQSPDSLFNFKLQNYLELLNNCIHEFHDLATKKNCAIIKNIPTNEVLIAIDEDEISLAITNLLRNALRFSPENSVISISVNENSNAIETIITDEGMGISEDNLPHIFEEYFVVNTFSEDKQKCIGLGLAIAKNIILRHKGKISVTSTLNKGTSFKISLPKKVK